MRWVKSRVVRGYCEIEMHTHIANPEALMSFDVYAWPNGDWCGVDALEDLLSMHSDDYTRLTVRVPDDFDDFEIEDAIDCAVATYFGGKA